MLQTIALPHYFHLFIPARVGLFCNARQSHTDFTLGYDFDNHSQIHLECRSFIFLVFPLGQ